MWIYLSLLLASIAVPLALSFDRKLHFWRKWNVVIPAIVIVAIVYILLDIIFTNHKIWGFNPRYHLGLTIMGLPVEECLFFLVIPYSSLFIHYAFFLYYPKAFLSGAAAKVLTFILLTITAVIIIFNHDKIYTVYALGSMLIALLFSFLDKSNELHKFYTSFLIILVPFVIVNGILTGSIIEQEVVWYNDAENLGLRLFTIPVEDFAYGFSLIFFNLLLIKLLEKRTFLKTH